MRTRLWVTLITLVLSPSLATGAKPDGWFLAGSDPGSYAIERDASVKHGGMGSGRLASIRAPKGFGTMMQSIDAADYRAKRVRYSAFVKASNVKSWAGMWMRVDGESQTQSLAFDNMQSRPIKGTKDWTRYSVVLDVAQNARGISFGILVDGEGTVWMNDVQFEVVDNSVPTTNTLSQGAKKPTNLNFEH